MFYIVFAIGLLFSLLPQKKIAAKIYAVILVVLAAFRFGSGADYFSYALIYYKALPSVINEISNPQGTHEIGFRLIEALFKSLGLSYQVFLAGMAVIGIYFIYKACVKYSSNPTLSLVIYFACYYFYWTYSALRQGFALTIGIYFLLETVRDNKTKKFIVITLLLSLIHASALYLLVLYFLSKLKLGKSQLIVITILAMIVGAFPIGRILLSLSKLMPALKRIVPYLSSDQSFINIFDIQTIGRLGFLVIAFVFYDRYAEQSHVNKKILNMYIISFILYFALKSVELMAARFAIYGRVLDIVILANIVYLIKNKYSRYIFIACLTGVLVAYLFKELAFMEYYIEIVDSNPYHTPYVNIFNKDNFVFTHSKYYRYLKTLH